MKSSGFKYSLEFRFLSGKKPCLEELTRGSGEWRVTMLTGVVPNMAKWPLKHRKRFGKADGKVSGTNVVFKNLTWGAFMVKEGRYSLVIDYSNCGNGRITSRFRDYIRTDPNYPGRLLGASYIVIKGSQRFVGYFKLEQV